MVRIGFVIVEAQAMPYGVLGHMLCWDGRFSCNLGMVVFSLRSLFRKKTIPNLLYNYRVSIQFLSATIFVLQRYFFKY